MSGLRTHVPHIQRRPEWQLGLNAELILICSRNLPARISHHERRGTQQYVFRVDSSNKVLLQGWANGYGRIPDRIENAVTLNAIVVNAATGTEHDLSLFGGGIYYDRIQGNRVFDSV